MTDDRNEIVEDALSKRLAKLASMPVDVSRLEAALRQHVGEKTTAARARRSVLARIGWKTIASVAASLILVAVIGWAVFLPSEAEASPADLARVHREMVAGTDTMRVGSTAEANQMIEAMAKGTVTIPAVAGRIPCACCKRTIGHKPVACVLLENGDQPVTMTVASANDMKCSGSTVTANGITYHTAHVGELNMVMTERNGRWVCLVSKAAPEQLLELAGKLQF